ncbi:hypothetical protein OG194_29755 [Streptomyces sp. NBC_01288]|uniref:hypothetical protein n=1 Tax=Streptomyces sp. NBC_01288 TaxID=2903814 RepID=UPI002E147D4F|nr:hypothetical protein OG194_29755 [Streptomyces sp. NBC_01288]
MTDDRHDQAQEEFGPLDHRRMLDLRLFPPIEVTAPGPREVPAALRGPAWQPQEQPPVYEQPATQWNGEPCTARRITAIVADNGNFPMYWARHLVGTRRAIVEVTYGGATFYLDDEDGSGWNKVTHGGSPHWTHNNITIDPDSIQSRAQTDLLKMAVESGATGVAELRPHHDELADACRPVEVDGETVRVHGSGQFTEQDQELVADVVRAGKRKFAKEALTTDASFLREHIAEALFDADSQVGPYRTVHSDTKDEYRRLAEAALAVVLPHGKFLGDRLHDTEEQLLAARTEAERWIAFIQRGMDTHMQFSVLRPDGIAEQLPCADWCYACRIEQAEAFTTAVAELIAAHEGDEWASQSATTALRELFTCTSVPSSVDDSGPTSDELVHSPEEQLVSAPPLVGDRFRLQADGSWAADVGGGTLTVVADMSGERREQLLALLDAYCQAIEENRLTPEQARADIGMPGT